MVAGAPGSVWSEPLHLLQSLASYFTHMIGGIIPIICKQRRRQVGSPHARGPKVAGSNPAPATKEDEASPVSQRGEPTNRKNSRAEIVGFGTRGGSGESRFATWCSLGKLD
jgi:hypothetical protein